MKSQILKITVALIMVAFVILPAFALMLPVQAADFGEGYVTGDTGDGSGLGLGTGDPRDIAAGLISVIMTFLSIIAVAIILLGGFKWMTAGGNEDKVAEARKLIVAGIIGLIIIIAAWVIASFVMDQMTGLLTE